MTKQKRNNSILAISILLLFFYSCKLSKQQKNSLSFVRVKDSIQQGRMLYVLEEFEVASTNKAISTSINKALKQLSVNNFKSEIPLERLKEKKEQLKKCLQENTMGCEGYSPERIHVVAKTPRFLSLKYSYNGLHDKDEYYKYATFSLVNGQRIMFNTIFKTPEKVLQLYEKKYVSNFSSANDIEEANAYLEVREKFRPKDLNNFDFQYNQNQRVNGINFYYNGLGGNYRSSFPPGYESFTIEELRPYIKEEFLKIIAL